MAQRVQRRLNQLVIGKQADLATPATSFNRTMRFRTGATVTKVRGEDPMLDSIGDASLWGPQDAPETTGSASTFSVPSFLELNDVLLPLLSGLQGGVTGVVDADVSTGYTWTFEPNLSATGRSAIDYYTLKDIRRDAGVDGAAQTVRTLDAPKAHCTQIQITIPEGQFPNGPGLVQLNCSYTAGRADDPGAALASPPALVRPPLFVSGGRVAMAIYDTWAAALAGSPGASLELRPGSQITIPTGLTPSDLRSDNAGLDFIALDASELPATATVGLYSGLGAAALEQTELAHRDAQDLRVLKFRFTANSSPEVEGADEFPLRMDVIMAMRHTPASLSVLGRADSRGRGITDMAFSSAMDTAQTAGLRVVVQNRTSAFPA